MGYLKDSGIFVVRSRVCVLSGNKNKSQGGLSYMGAVSPAYTPSGPGPSSGSSQGMMGRGGLGKPMQQKDSMIGKTVMIIKGGYKGFLAHVNDATETHYQVEILAKLKKISIEKAKTKLAGDNLGSLTADGQRPTQEHNQALLLSQATPYMQGATPMHGSATPMYTGSETPMHGTPRGNRTPGRDDDGFNPWNTTSSTYQQEMVGAAGGE